MILRRYIFREVFRVFLLATLALTAILSLGMILRPVQEHGVGPQQVFNLIGYFLPITLTFVLPISALFATSLVYGRFASDNELDACRASGVSLTTLVYPGLILALMIAIANLLLSFYVTPIFFERAQKSLKADVQKIIFRNIQRRGHYISPDKRWQIYADQIDSKNKILSGVIITEVKYPRIEKVITCEDAKVDFNPQKRFNDVLITARNTYEITNKHVLYNELFSGTREFPSLLGDDIKFKRIDKIKQIQSDKMLFDPIAKLAYSTYAQLTTELLAQQISERINNPENRYYQLYSGRKIIKFTSDECTMGKEKEIILGGNIIAEEFDQSSPNELVRRLECSKAQINIEGEEDLLTISLSMNNVEWQREDQTEGLAGFLLFRGLVIPNLITQEIDKYGTGNILESISESSVNNILKNGPSDELKSLEARLSYRINKTLAQIRGEIHTRLAFGIGCVPLIMIGIGLGIIKKGGHLLSAFGVSSIPAAVLIICMMSGKNIVENPDSNAIGGAFVIWAGPAVLIIITGIIYRFLLKQ